jgi:hypothetical protein
MGYSLYSVDLRQERSVSSGYTTKSVNEIFTQNVKRNLHEQMNPTGVIVRESCDSPSHPNTTPIQLYLDVTGSMGHIPHEMIKNGLPTLMGSLIQSGVSDASLMFGAIGDHECDRCPLQVAQFESGDAELDMWLTRTYLEGGGGGNDGESYLLAWYFAANHVKTDSFDKRGKKGFVFTIGDEPCLRNLPHSAVKGIMGESATGQGNLTSEELLNAAQQKNHVYHIHIEHGGRSCDPRWKQMLGDNLIVIQDYTTVSKVISDVILSKSDATNTNTAPNIMGVPNILSDNTTNVNLL